MDSDLKKKRQFLAALILSAFAISCVGVGLLRAEGEATTKKMRRIRIHRNGAQADGSEDVIAEFDLPADEPVYGIPPITKANGGDNRSDWYNYGVKNWENLTPEEQAQYPGGRDEYAKSRHNLFTMIGEGLADMLAGRIWRTYAYNTQPDGSGDYYRLGWLLPEEAPDELDLYTMWVKQDELLKSMDDIQQVKPVIYLEGSPEHISPELAYNVDKSGTLHYRAKLDFSNIRENLKVLWGRIDKVISWKGYVKAIFDKRLAFDREVEIAYESTWQRLDPDKVDEIGAKNIRYEGTKTYFTFEAERLEQFRNQDGDYEISIPVTLIPWRDLANLPFEDFMKPMWISVADNFENGLNAHISDESYLKISTSDNPILKVGGQINLEIVGDTGALGGIQTFTNDDPKADDVYARLFPHGTLHVDYKEYRSLETLTPDSNPTSGQVAVVNTHGKTKEPKEERLAPNATEILTRGRSEHQRYDEFQNDAENYANRFSVKVPAIDGYAYLGDLGLQGLTGELNQKPLEGAYNYKIPEFRTLLYVRNSTVIVRHLTVTGESLAQEIIMTNEIDEPYETEKLLRPVYAGKDYRFVSMKEGSDPAVGRYGNRVKVVTYLYEPVGGEPSPTVTPTPALTATPTPLPSLTVTPKAEPSPSPVQAKETNLPKAGEGMTTFPMLAFMGLAILALGAKSIIRRR